MYIIEIIIGLVAGTLGGLIGTGGAVIMIPALVLLLGYNQHMAQGTALTAMIPPIGLLAAYEYYKEGNVNIPAALFIAGGFFIGGFFGAKIAALIDDNILRKIFGLILLLISIRMIIK